MAFVGETDEPTLALGRIEIGQFSEYFHIDVGYWAQSTYESQWKQGIARLLQGASSSCLLQSVPDPETGALVFLWRLYRIDGDEVAVQNAIVVDPDQPFDARDPYPAVRPRYTVSEDGQRVSEWRTTLAELSEFANTLRSVPASSGK